MKSIKLRRDKIAKKLPKQSLLVLSSANEFFRQPDVLYPYRQESHFYYMTGFTEPQAHFLLFSSGQSVLFIEDKEAKKELWEGTLYSKLEVKKKYKIDHVFYLSEIQKSLPKKLKKTDALFYEPNPSYTKGSPQALIHKILKDKISKNTQKKSAFEFLRPFRQVKSQEEIQSLKKACSYSIQAHKEIARILSPGISERTLHGQFIHSIMEQGALREAYPAIIASGEKALTLHYKKNNSVCKKGDLLLVDAGAEADYYASDITRVYPVSGRFSKAQKKAYQLLLDLQKQLIKEVFPGQSLKTLNEKMRLGITEILLELGLLKGSLEKNLKDKKYKTYCPHSVGHLLGLDVHDVTFKKTEEALLKPHMVLTIEPGLYISQKDKKAPPSLRGLGLRIEDDILVTERGSLDLTKKLPKEIEEVEELCSL